jgi:hypothetical protein
MIAAMRILARDIQSGDGVANAAIAEAADRLEKLDALLRDIIHEEDRHDNGRGIPYEYQVSARELLAEAGKTETQSSRKQQK